MEHSLVASELRFPQILQKNRVHNKPAIIFIGASKEPTTAFRSHVFVYG